MAWCDLRTFGESNWLPEYLPAPCRKHHNIGRFAFRPNPWNSGEHARDPSEDRARPGRGHRLGSMVPTTDGVRPMADDEAAVSALEVVGWPGSATSRGKWHMVWIWSGSRHRSRGWSPMIRTGSREDGPAQVIARQVRRRRYQPVATNALTSTPAPTAVGLARLQARPRTEAPAGR